MPQKNNPKLELQQVTEQLKTLKSLKTVSNVVFGAAAGVVSISAALVIAYPALATALTQNIWGAELSAVAFGPALPIIATYAGVLLVASALPGFIQSAINKAKFKLGKLSTANQAASKSATISAINEAKSELGKSSAQAETNFKSDEKPSLQIDTTHPQSPSKNKKQKKKKKLFNQR